MLNGCVVHLLIEKRLSMLIAYFMHARIAFAIAAAVLFPSAGFATALAPVPGAAVTAAGTGATAPIPIGDILSRASQEQQRLALATQLVTSSAQVGILRAALEEIADPVDTKLDATSGIVLGTLPVMRLESLARHYEFDARRLADWDARARHAFAPYDDIAVQLAQSRAAWSATRAAGAGMTLPPVLAERIDAILAQLMDVETRLATVLRAQFDLMQRSAALKTRIDAGLTRMDAVIAQVDERILSADALPLWRVTGNRNGSGELWESLERGLAIERQFAIDYNAADTGNQMALRVVQLTLLPLLLWLGTRKETRAHAVKGSRAPRALRRPFSAWILLSMLSVLILEPDAPLLVHEIALLVALVPLLRLLPGGFGHMPGAWSHLALALYALDRFSILAVADNGLYRWLLLVLNVLALHLAWRALRIPCQPRADGGSTAWQGAIRFTAWAGLALLSTALVANVIGNASLAETVTSGVIDSAYMAILLYASAVALRDIARALASRQTLAGNRFAVRHYAELQASLSMLLLLAATCAWLVYSLDRLRLLRPVRAVLVAIMDFGLTLGQVSIHIGGILTLVVSAWLAYWAARLVRRILREELPRHRGLPRGVGSSIASLSYYAVLLAGLLLALSAAGVQLGQLAIVFGALGVGIGFGLQNVVNNFVSGLVLMFERPIQPGDTVDAAGVSGTVREISLRSTTIRTFDGADAVVPNGALLNGSLTNWTMYDRSRRFEIALGISYDADPVQVLDILRTVVADTPDIATTPAPKVMLAEYGESALRFVISIWTDDADRWLTIRGDLLARILPALRAAGIGIASRQLDINLHTAPAKTALPEATPP